MNDKRNIKFKRDRRTDTSDMLYGMIPPQARNLEESVLGACLIEKDAITNICDFLKPESFYVDANATIYRTMLSLYSKSQPIDMLTVTEELRNNGKLEEVGGAFYLSELTNRIASSANIEFHARVVVEKWMLREVISVSSVSTKDAYEDTVDVFDLVDNMQKNINNIIEFTVKKDFEHIGTKIFSDVEVLENARLSDNHVTGVPTGILPIDKFFHGLKPSDLIILAARPSMGKTGMAISITHGAASLGEPVGFCSLEMPGVQVRQRLLSIESGVGLEEIRNAKYSDNDKIKIFEAASRIKKLPIYVDDQPSMSLMELKAKARRLWQRYGIKMLFVDYLQLMRGENKQQNREQEISEISRGLKGLAKELNIPVVALSQLNRSVESRGGEKRPNLSDLRESGAIEQDADVVMFLYRPEYYGLLDDNSGHSNIGKAVVIVAKNRNGATGDITDGLGFKKQCAQFYYQDEMYENMQRDIIGYTPKEKPFDIF